ncbi:nucleotide exchange factor GrpE [Xanthomonas sp. XNM01]|uniref:nucleotide exchange factor GrpE n=1 Tax=Xanthomonas sp. XNM01 TaxID=2769289 RepID=UPI0017839361|nr:nucleotide exchange factor GrpE [Xanthomonas sp. XNM01]MBD9368242.1 nucleotide exchange factor GrpE [Xanthomonas sp. XNM01]
MTQNETPSTPNATESHETPLEQQLRDEIAALHSEIEQLRMDSLRERADLENQRKRVARDVEQARKFANERLLGELLPVFDSLDAGLSAAGGEGGPLRDGMELTYKQLLKVAGDNGLSLVDPVGQPFNPEHHQAISQADAAGVAPGSVVQVFQKGYLLNERLLRPALVVVARQD